MSKAMFDNDYFSDPTLLSVVAVLVAVVVVNLVVRFVLHRLELATKYTDTLWDDALIQAARRPLPALAWVLGLCRAPYPQR